jgi:hypothetical protein
MEIEECLHILQTLPFQDLGFAKVDHHRELRTGFPEVIYCPGKTPEQVLAIATAMLGKTSRIMISRAETAIYDYVKNHIPEAEYNQTAKYITIGHPPTKDLRNGLTVVAAGTSDLPVAEEAAVIAEFMGCKVERIWDVGIAGLHRLISKLETLQNSNVIVVVAGMEGALPSLVAGLVSAPVIAVPTSVGYGANFEGLSALLTMLNSCSTGIAVVNIDNGFGAGYMAATINLSITNPK